MRLSLKTKTALLVTSLVLLLVGGLGAVRYRQLSHDYLSLLLRQEQQRADVVARELDFKLATHWQRLEREAQRAPLQVFADPAVRQRFLAESGLRPSFDGVAVIDANGNVLANDPPNPKPVNIGDRDYFQRARATGAPAVSRPVASRATGDPVVLMVVPVHGADGRVLGMIGAGLNLQRPNVLGSLNQARGDAPGHAVVTTAEPQPLVIAHPDRAQLLQPALPVHASGDHDLAGDIVSVRTMPSTGWQLRLVVPRDQARAPLDVALRTLLIHLVIQAVSCSLLVLLGIGWLLRPLQTLTHTVRRLKHDPQAELALDVRRTDELGELASEFGALMERVRQQQGELAAVNDALPLGLFRCDRDGRVTYANDTYFQIQGLNRAQMAEGWLCLIPPEKRAQVRDEWRRQCESDAPAHSTQHVKLSDGSEALLSVRSAAVRVDGEVIGRVGTISDITERARAEKAQRMLTAILDTTTDYVVQTDPAGRMLYMNNAARRVAGLAPDAPLDGLTIAHFNPPETIDRHPTEILPIVKARGVWIGETVAYDAERRKIPVSHVLLAHRDRHGQIEHFSAILRDISKERSAQQALQRQEATLRSVTEEIPAVVAVVGADRCYRFVNSAFERWCGLPRERMIGRPMPEVLGDTEYHRSAVWVERALAGETVRFEKDYPGPDRGLHFEITYIPLRLEDGRVDGFVSMAHDITHRKHEELRLRELTLSDPLTGVLNRPGLEQHLEQRLRVGAGPRLALLYIDLDHFKPVNDCHGHAVGDEVLRVFAKRLRNIVRPSDAVARLGGDEFALVLDGLRDPSNAKSVAAKVVEMARRPIGVGELRITIGASVGIALGVEAQTGWQELIARADAMLYRAKNAGRGKHAIETVFG